MNNYYNQITRIYYWTIKYSTLLLTIIYKRSEEDKAHFQTSGHAHILKRKSCKNIIKVW